MKRYLIAGAALLLSANALAEECANATTQLEMNTCTAQQYQAADKKLNQTYQAAIKRAEAPQRELLKKAQQAWIALRDADCNFIGSGTEGGSVQPMIISQCLSEKTVEREAFLASLMQCEEGDLSCPLPPGN
ncbi:lysozyme inhibitor LprI family protein [Enterobacter ludwigii]|uniref:lysozyme inhibitor LprI family protein n=1 Tax=Enterobacter TaxID=547 RepID=UPI000EB56A39|nr:lysozyme inhibitor LprI family protein [Enterobacter ludwigii]MCR5992206.1 lysozyme inhibitor LprI family protein [Enterobacter ludwigii]WFY42595.1 lysozyme inhibitor LprI family protein [Enterobacter ludwigii]WGA06274.1 lysozyme inhibitor LprI family protein [Enterobacter ludwigii]WGC27117.1 lysozyme inhibitor LprI family protein [Enterobacter ludwigii]